MPKNNVSSPAAAADTMCAKNNMTVYPPYGGPVPDAFQQVAMPVNGQYPVASKFSLAPILTASTLYLKTPPPLHILNNSVRNEPI